MSILILQHSTITGPERLGMTLRDHAQQLDVRRLDLAPEEGGRPIPDDFDGIEGIVSYGGPQNVGDDIPWMHREIEFLREAHERGLPIVGICLGAQLLAAALGGTVEKMDGTGEIGFCPVEQTPAGNTDPVLAGIPWLTMQFQVHQHAITEPPEGAVVLQRSDACAVQAYRVGLRAYGFQYHPEAKREMMHRLAQRNDALFAQLGLGPGDFDRHCDEHEPTFARLSDRLCLNLASYVFPVGRVIEA